MRTVLLFAKRNLTEILRDPLSYIFCLALPAVMLIVFQLMPTGGLEIFRIGMLTPSITVFSMAFAMLFMALLVSSDRESSLLTRLYTSPMRPVHFIAGYLLPGMLLGLIQALTCTLCGWIIALVGSENFEIWRVLLSFLTLLPIMGMYVCIGLIFGSLLNSRSAPGISSAVITCSGFLGGAWTYLEPGSAFTTVCRILPFYPGVMAQRTVFLGHALTWNDFFCPWLTVWGYGIVFALVAVLVFKRQMRRL